MRDINIGALRGIVKDQPHLAHWISIPALLRRLGLDAPLKDAQMLVRGAQQALQRGELDAVAFNLDLADSQFKNLLGRDT
jgi:hypothetical protein